MPKHSVANWTGNVPAPMDQSCNYTAETCDQINDPGMTAHKEMEERTGNGYHQPPSTEEGVEYEKEN